MKTNLNMRIAERLAVAVVNDAIPLGGFATALCQAFCKADSSNRAKILKGFESDFLAWNEYWGNEVNAWHAD